MNGVRIGALNKPLQPEVAKQLSRMEAGLGNLERELDGLSSSIEVLEARLSAVLGVPAPQPTVDPCSPEVSTGAAHTRRIEEAVTRVSGLQWSIRAIIERLEV